MPRALTPPYTFTLDPIYLAVPGQPITAAQFNTPMQDIQSTFNTVQPINFGGTGAASAPAALIALGAADATTVVLKTGSTMTGQLVNTGSTVGYTPFQAISTEAAAAAGPIVETYRNSASPAAADLVGQIDFNGQNSTPAKKTYARQVGRIIDPTAASEDGATDHYAMVAGTLTKMFGVGPNLDLTIGQIKFPVAQNASADPNTLDDYEEGTFTPAFSATGCTFNYASQVGTYTKVGNRATITIQITLAGSGNTLAANPLTITGFPFANADTVSCQFPLFFTNTTSSYVALWGQISASTSSAGVVGNTAAATTLGSVQNASVALHATNGTSFRATFQMIG